MRAMILKGYGLEPVAADLSDPAPGASEVLVRVRATGINPIDWKRASGRFRPILRTSFPFIAGFDLSGEIEALGSGVTGFTRGQRVHTCLSGQKGGASASLATAGLDVLRPIPEGMDFEQAAGLPLAGMTALQGLRDVGGLPESGASKRVLVVGASGGVGHLAVQIAKAMGAHVTGVCSERNTALVRRLGAQATVDYTKANAYEGLPPFDLILDCVGSAPAAFLDKLVPRGVFAACVPGPAVFARRALNLLSSRQVLPVMMRPNASDLAVLDGLFEKKKLEVVIDSRYPAEQLGQAWKRSASGRTAGKIVVTW